MDMAIRRSAQLFIGTSGYSYPDWKSVVYPRTLKRDVGGPTPELTYLSRYFNTCEINATFYRQFEPEIAKRWTEAVENPDFEFAIKANLWPRFLCTAGCGCHLPGHCEAAKCSG